jgi:hypothetical protein
MPELEEPKVTDASSAEVETKQETDEQESAGVKSDVLLDEQTVARQAKLEKLLTVDEMDRLDAIKASTESGTSTSWKLPTTLEFVWDIETWLHLAALIWLSLVVQGGPWLNSWQAAASPLLLIGAVAYGWTRSLLGGKRARKWETGIFDLVDMLSVGFVRQLFTMVSTIAAEELLLSLLVNRAQLTVYAAVIVWLIAHLQDARDIMGLLFVVRLLPVFGVYHLFHFVATLFTNDAESIVLLRIIVHVAWDVILFGLAHKGRLYLTDFIIQMFSKQGKFPVGEDPKCLGEMSLKTFMRTRQKDTTYVTDAVIAKVFAELLEQVKTVQAATYTHGALKIDSIQIAVRRDHEDRATAVESRWLKLPRDRSTARHVYLIFGSPHDMIQTSVESNIWALGVLLVQACDWNLAENLGVTKRVRGLPLLPDDMYLRRSRREVVAYLEEYGYLTQMHPDLAECARRLMRLDADGFLPDFSSTACAGVINHLSSDYFSEQPGNVST